MTPKTQMTTDLSVFFNTDEFAEPITYAGSSITAVVEIGAAPKREDEAHLQRAEIWIKRSDVSDPAYRDKVVIDSVTWRVLGTLMSDDDICQLELFRDERPVV